jgi:hypothetical protein
MRRLAAVAAFALVACKGKSPEERYGKPPTLDPAIAQAAEKRMAELQSLSQQLASRDVALDTTSVPRPDLGDCPVTPPFPTEIVQPGGDVPNPALILSDKVHDVLSDLATAVNGGTYAEAEQVNAAMAVPAPDAVAILLVDASQDATFDEHSFGNGFEGGFVTGRAYLWSASAGKVVCVGDVMAQNSTNISYTAENNSVDAYYGRNDRGEIRAALDQDLRAQVQRAILASFEHAAGPAEARRAPKKAR